MSSRSYHWLNTTLPSAENCIIIQEILKFILKEYYTEVDIFSPAVDANDIFGSKRIAVGNFGTRSLALDLSQSYDMKPEPRLLGE